MDWVRGEKIGHGSFATISKAKPKKGSSDKALPPLMAVKSSQGSSSETLKNEKRVLGRIGTCPQIIRCFGDQNSFENGEKLHNLLLEYASGGSLADQVKLHGGKLPEPDIRRHTRAVLKGLSFVHAKGFVHCDIKLQNILFFDNGAAKIADFGLAKEASKTEEAKTEHRCELRGTPLYMSPESVNDNEYEPPCDIWALGCAVVEMATGKPAWNNREAESNIWKLLVRIGGEELPGIPEELSEEGRDFLSKCFVKDPRRRWTAEMLLNHAFVGGDDDDDDGSDDTVLLEEANRLSASPRCPFDFPEWVSCTSEPHDSHVVEISPESDYVFLYGSGGSTCIPFSPSDRVRQLFTDAKSCCSFSDDWVTVRNNNSF
ncbi:Serine/threonine protein kinase [Trema orientale]|uniref:Serine/threonine protein kinase n=1 Tax=Trema orientale TaxID=63057 RepID=A0A2P5FYE4_TREOI|nr:Serine/threonine protein kinase [Trema orientale]